MSCVLQSQERSRESFLSCFLDPLLCVRGGGDADDALYATRRSPCANESVIIQLFCRKRLVKMRYPMLMTEAYHVRHTYMKFVTQCVKMRYPISLCHPLCKSNPGLDPVATAAQHTYDTNPCIFRRHRNIPMTQHTYDTNR